MDSGNNFKMTWVFCDYKPFNLGPKQDSTQAKKQDEI